MDPKGEKIPVAKQPLETALLLTFLGCSSIALTQWSVNPIETVNIATSMLKNINEDVYFSACANKYKVNINSKIFLLNIVKINNLLNFSKNKFFDLFLIQIYLNL